MNAIVSEIIEKPLSIDDIASRYRALCEDPRYVDVQGKFEIDFWGRITMSPANNLHGLLQGRLVHRLFGIGGHGIPEAAVLTPAGVLVPDVVWASDAFLRTHGSETPFLSAPELCVEVASPSNSRRELVEKTAAYLAAGATEAWIVYPQARRFEFHGVAGPLGATAFAIDLQGFFD